MPLEATMMIIDNSEYMRNGDYQPTRFHAQSDAVTNVFQTKIDSNPENTVGVMTMAGKGPEVLVTHTKDIGQILQGLHVATSKIGGEIDIPTAIAVAQLALKHRENKNLRQRIIVFVASPLDGQAADEKAMVRLAKKLKKNNVAIDVICFGDGIEEAAEDGKTVLRTFVESANSSDNSHLVTIPPSTRLLSEQIANSAILAADRGAGIPDEFMPRDGPAPSSSNGNEYEFGVDPNVDPELAMALRMSMREAQAREAAEAATTSQPNPTESTTQPPTGEEDEDEELRKALAMSEEKDVEMEDDEFDDDEDDDEDEEDEEAAIARAIEMSMQEQKDQDKDSSKQK
ncbi:hypothetical protein AGABI1DRAFT_112251 [Agaricus bisporus var. burnettii JB137-S8]|uniref:VWFA domain-containing protein n=1 Tax=Agaricus bisporus var. burnettii (strain JB137-S8 / ATCC MYA-4627 / FGSC 10392) TaxID=597362 RepID=K5W5Q6_AGABU|nr:uncharacterized protein AGABI1DRAFT_112251 [Agaricus bisporus var. burnettii JB137-S8]EKM82134.1 hypothetical protein AGABI1DRAFT_112251 [Agaricus bisporus var. burnettii JB137-S8]